MIILAVSAAWTKASGACSGISTRRGLANNTLIVYSSDQGFFLGEHGWFDKRWIFEESVRSPLLIRWPDVIKPGGVNSDLVSNLDFAETFLDVAGLPVPAEMQGRSMLPIFRGHASRLALGLLLPILRIPTAAPCPATLRHRD